MSNQKLPQPTATALATQIVAQPGAKIEGAPKEAAFTFILEAANGYKAEGFYPSITPQQYQQIVAVLEGKTDGPRIIVAS